MTVFAGVQRGVYKMDIGAGVDIADPRGSADFSLDDVYPNPANGMVTVSYGILRGGPVFLKAYDILGREIRTLVNEYRHPGHYRVPFDSSRLSSGVYFIRANGGGVLLTRRFLLVK